MFASCTLCGESSREVEIDAEGRVVCASCGAARGVRRLPLLMVGGPAGVGKSTVGAHLVGAVTEAVLLDADLLWRPEFNTPRDGYHSYFSLWLRLAANVAQAGRPAALFGAGFAVPHNTEALPERRLFSAVHYLALVCDDETLAARLRRRPRWRDTSQSLVDEHLAFNRWLRENHARTAPTVTLLDTTEAPAEETARRVGEWIRRSASDLGV